MFWGPYMWLVIPPMILALYASWKVKSTFAKYSQLRSSSGMSGAQAARAILDRNGLQDVTIEPVEGELTDHYDPREKVLRLSTPVYRATSLAALGVAAHEAGHAIQDARGYVPLKVRSGIYPIAAFGNNFGVILVMIGMFLLWFGAGEFARTVALIGIVLFGAGTVFTLVTLPVEFNASRRALAMLSSEGIVTVEEQADARRVLSAAALTYVAAAFVAVMMLLRFILMFLSASRRD